jgi:hypothetical protein
MWQPIKTAPRDGTNILLRFGSDGVSQGKYIPGLPHPWQFIDTNNGVSWLINYATDGSGGPSHWMPLPTATTQQTEPKQQKWIGLTSEEIWKICEDCFGSVTFSGVDLVDQVQKLLKEKNKQ